jgi:hypothetical protein
LPLWFVASTLFVLVDLYMVFDVVWGGTFSLSASSWSSTPLRLLWRTLSIMMFLIFLEPTSKSLVECSQAPLMVFPYLSMFKPRKQKVYNYVFILVIFYLG